MIEKEKLEDSRFVKKQDREKKRTQKSTEETDKNSFLNSRMKKNRERGERKT